MTLKAQIQEDVKSAMRARDQKRLTALRLITAAIKQIEVDKRIEMDDQAVLAVLDKMVKQRRESLAQFEAAGREDLAAQEKFELELIAVYLPEALSDDEVAALIKKAIADTGASSIRDMGAVMNALRGEVQGRADMKAVSSTVKELLGA
ncbi:MAG: GatB/YqeY domain-containing protein [Xanthomonadales bacterium]|nr:GatB/YqeY domain-containing protein [Gammaproteobacteria bacterium]NNK04470.1 GatB/YqeY domain-containing protein [Xanthomonadales bacterium]